MVEEKGEQGERMDTVDTILPALARCINILPIMMEMEPELVWGNLGFHVIVIFPIHILSIPSKFLLRTIIEMYYFHS